MSTPRRFRKRPVEITALQLTRENVADVEAFINARIQPKKLPGPGRGITDGLLIHTLEGDMRASWGDWIIRGIEGEFYPCKPDIFEQTYEPAGEES